MTALVAWRDVREALRLDGSYERTRRRRLRTKWISERRWLWTAVRFGSPVVLAYLLPVLVPVVVASEFHDDSGSVAVLALVLLARRGYDVGRRDSRFAPFEVLRLPSRASVLAARTLRRLPHLLWMGTCAAAAAWLVAKAAQRTTEPWAALLVVTAAIGPLFAYQRGLSCGAFSRSRESTRRTTAGCLLLAAAVLAFRVVDGPERLAGRRGALLGFWAVIVALGSTDLLRPGRLVQGVLHAVLDVAVAVGVVALLAAKPSHLATLPEGPLTAFAAVAAAWCAAGCALYARDAARLMATTDVVEVETADAPTSAAGDAATPWTPRARPGRGLWRASWERWRRKELPLPDPVHPGWRERLADWGVTALAVAVALFRALFGPAVAALAVFAPVRPDAVGFGVAALAVFTSRRFVATTPDARLHLLGVDYVVQARNELRALLVCAALPTVAAATAAAAWRGFPPDAVWFAASVASLFVARAGWPGLVDDGFRLLGCLPLLAAAGLLALSGRWPDVALVTTGLTALVGGAGLVRRLVRLDEDRLRAAMRG